MYSLYSKLRPQVALQAYSLSSDPRVDPVDHYLFPLLKVAESLGSLHPLSLTLSVV